MILNGSLLATLALLLKTWTLLKELVPSVPQTIRLTRGPAGLGPSRQLIVLQLLLVSIAVQPYAIARGMEMTMLAPLPTTANRDPVPPIMW